MWNSKKFLACTEHDSYSKQKRYHGSNEHLWCPSQVKNPPYWIYCCQGTGKESMYSFPNGVSFTFWHQHARRLRLYLKKHPYSLALSPAGDTRQKKEGIPQTAEFSDMNSYEVIWNSRRNEKIKEGVFRTKKKSSTSISASIRVAHFVWESVRESF